MRLLLNQSPKKILEFATTRSPQERKKKQKPFPKKLQQNQTSSSPIGIHSYPQDPSVASGCLKPLKYSLAKSKTSGFIQRATTIQVLLTRDLPDLLSKKHFVLKCQQHLHYIRHNYPTTVPQKHFKTKKKKKHITTRYLLLTGWFFFSQKSPLLPKRCLAKRTSSGR